MSSPVPKQEVKVAFSYTHGVDNVTSVIYWLLNEAKERGLSGDDVLVEQAGSWFSVKNGDHWEKSRAKDLKKVFEDNPLLLDSLKEKVKELWR